MNNFIDHYCERITTSLWDEPFNIISNIAFIIVAIVVFRKAQSTIPAGNNRYTDIWILTALILTIGVGSALWHILAQYWALWTDRTPILLFISLFLLSCLVRVLHLSLVKAIIVLLILHASNGLVLSIFPTATLNGSLFYLPTALLLFGISFVLWHKGDRQKSYFLAGSILLTIAITFRTVDLSACGTIPVGTHFIWHILVAITIYVLMTALLNSVVYNQTNAQ